MLFFCSAATHQRNSKKLFLEAEPGDFSCIAYLPSMLFLTIFGEATFQLIKINWACVFILIKFAHGTDVRLVHLFQVFGNTSSQLKNDWNQFYETTDQLQQFRTEKFSTFFSRAKPLRSPQLVKLNSFNFDWKRCNTSKGFRGLFVYCICSKNESFLSVFSKAAFLSFTFFSSGYQLCVLGFLIKQLFYSG